MAFNNNAMNIKVDSPNVCYTEEYIVANYKYSMVDVKAKDKDVLVHPKQVELNIKTKKIVPKLGLMLVGWGGNNGSTLTAGLIANKLGLSWNTKDGVKKANWLGSITQSSTVKLGTDSNGKDFYCPLSSLLPLVNPNDIVIDGWDISSMNLADAMERAKVLDYNLQEKLKPLMEDMKPRPSIYFPDFIAENQSERADNIMEYAFKKEALGYIRSDINEFRRENSVEKVIVMWTANTEKFVDVCPEKNDTAENLLKSIDNEDEDISPSILFAVASILEGCIYINGSPQNTLVPGVIDLAEKYGAFIAGDDFKSGQTKVKSVLVDFLVSAGIKPVSIVSYNHLGNNDGKNLSAPDQFRSKEISKSNVVDDMVASNRIIYSEDEKPDHCVVIKYVPYVGDSKRAMDEYTSEICMGGHNIISMHNTCEDSLLAAPLMLDLAVLAELFTRIEVSSEKCTTPCKFNCILSILSYLLKAPLVSNNGPVVNSLFRQKACIENVMKACIGLPPDNNMCLENKLPDKLFGAEREFLHLNGVNGYN